ncbi:MAG: type II secretion system protein [Verrucomicrobiota bacterium]
MPFSRPNQRSSQVAAPARRWRAGFSMSEIVVSISILGILATVVILNLGSNYESIKQTLAQEKAEMLNRGLGERAASHKEYTESAATGASWDESLLLLTLQYRDPDDSQADLNSPYIDPRYRPKTSSSTNAYRLQWNGRRFEVLRPGTTGSGLLIAFDGSDYGEPRVYPPDFTTNGR